jgi:serine/threonine-protein kinase RsbW
MDRRIRSFPSTVDATVEASAFVLETAEAFGVAHEIREALTLVVGEAVANAVSHGNNFDSVKEVTVECTKRDGELHLCVEDGGEGVPANRLETASLPEDPLDTSGRGLYIMRSLAERIWLEESGRRLCMMWRLTEDA